MRGQKDSTNPGALLTSWRRGHSQGKEQDWFGVEETAQTFTPAEARPKDILLTLRVQCQASFTEVGLTRLSKY